MGFDRSKYANRQVKQQTVVKSTSTDATYTDRAPALYMNKMKDGSYKMKIMPPHNLELDFYQQLSTYLMKVEVERDGKKQLGLKSIFSGEVHSETGKCIVAEYVNFAKSEIENETLDAVKKKEKLETLLGEPYNPKNKTPKYGIKASNSFPMYVYIEGTGLENGNGVYKLMANWTFKSRLQEIESQNQDVDQPMKVDIFTDPVGGTCVGLVVNSSLAGKEKYKVDPILKPIEVKDFFYEFWEKQTPLDQLYVNSYTQRDFELAMEGLSNFEEETGFNYLGREEFLNIAEELSSLYPSLKEQKSESEETEKTGIDLIEDSDVKEKKQDSREDELAALKAKLAALQG